MFHKLISGVITALFVGLVGCGASAEARGSDSTDEARLAAASSAVRARAVRATYDEISGRIGSDVRVAIAALPRAVLSAQVGANSNSVNSPNVGMSLALPRAIRSALRAHRLDSISDSHVEQLAFVVAVDIVHLVNEQQMASSELAMAKIQSAMAARAQLLELISNMLASHAETLDTIIGRIN